jgi:hypothetical protein
MSRFTTIPNKKYWGVFDLTGKTSKDAMCVAMFLDPKKAKEWKSVYFRRDDAIVQECYAQISVKTGE